MPDKSEKIAVLGAGTMGAQIAAHFANASVPSLLLDVSAEQAEALGAQAERCRRLDPANQPGEEEHRDRGAVNPCPRGQSP